MRKSIQNAKNALVELANRINSIQRFSVQEGAAINAAINGVAASLNAVEKEAEAEEERLAEQAAEAGRKAAAKRNDAMVNAGMSIIDAESKRKAEGAEVVDKAMQKK